jgi:hypothetical protein
LQGDGFEPAFARQLRLGTQKARKEAKERQRGKEKEKLKG